MSGQVLQRKLSFVSGSSVDEVVVGEIWECQNHGVY